MLVWGSETKDAMHLPGHFNATSRFNMEMQF